MSAARRRAPARTAPDAADIATGAAAMLRSVLFLLRYRGLVDDLVLGELFEIARADLRAGTPDDARADAACAFCDTLQASLQPEHMARR